MLTPSLIYQLAEYSMCSPVDEMEALSISPQASEEGALHSLISFDRLSFKGPFADVSEFDESVCSDYSPSSSDHVFREGSRVIAEEMMLVLKRANPVTEYRDEGDFIHSPIAKRKRRTYHYYDDDDNDEYSTNEFDERDGAEDLSHDPLDCNPEQGNNDEYLTDSTSESTRSQQMSNILGVLQQASSLID
jgi:hypothetical protein